MPTYLEDGVTIDGGLPPTGTLERTHKLAVAKDGSTTFASAAQLLALIDRADLPSEVENALGLAESALQADAAVPDNSFGDADEVFYLSDGEFKKGTIAGLIASIRVPAGTINAFAMPAAPTGWLKANGAAISRSVYTDLFAALVTGVGFTAQTFTVTIAAPGVLTKSAHGFTGGERLRLSTTGALPAGLNTTSDFFVIYVNANTFRLASSQANQQAGAAITTTGSQSGTHSFLRSLWGLGDGSTTFNVPDLRGEFLRGWDDARGIDSNRALGSYQQDEMQDHGHRQLMSSSGVIGGAPQAPGANTANSGSGNTLA